jgi:P4 family phage/plasmid primase-like protien
MNSTRVNGHRPFRSELDTGLDLLQLGFWVVAIHPGAKRPIGKDWGRKRWTEADLREAFSRHPGAGIGIVLGPGRSPSGSWLIDLEGDGDQADESFSRLVGGEVIATRGWSSARGSHRLMLADGERLLELLAAAGAKEGKKEKVGTWHLAEFPGLEIRVGGFKEDGTVKQCQSVAPPTVGDDGRPRQWNGVEAIAELPEASYGALEAIAERRAMQEQEPTKKPTSRVGTLSAEQRAINYLQRCEGAVSGRRGHSKTLAVACRTGPGLDLPRDVCLNLMRTEYNPRCQPPWSEEELARKVDEAYRLEKRPRGWLLKQSRNRRAGSGGSPAATGPESNGKPPVNDQSSVGIGEQPVNLTELGNARRLIARHGHRLRYCKPLGSWLEWDDKRWAFDDTGAIWRYAKDMVRQLGVEAANEPDDKHRSAILRWALKSEGQKTIGHSVDLAWSEPGIPIMPDALDADPWLLNTPSGTVDLRTGQLRPHCQTDLISKITGVAYDPSADCPRWKGVLLDIFDGDHELVDYVQRAFGYSATGIIGEHALFLCYGTGRNGKSTVLETVLAVLGDYGAVTNPRTFLMIGQNDHLAMLADLAGRRFVPTDEVEEGERLAESMVKRVTGNRVLKARWMHKNPFTFPVQFKIWMLANDKPEIQGQDEGIWSRIRVVPFNHYFPPEKRVKNLVNILVTEEGPGILRWIVDGCLQWQEKKGLAEPAKVADAIASYRSEQDVLIGFLEQETVSYLSNEVLRDQSRAKVGDLYGRYVEWCKNNGEKRVLTSRKFGSRLDARGHHLDESHGIRYRKGIVLKNETATSSGKDDKK